MPTGPLAGGLSACSLALTACAAASDERRAGYCGETFCLAEIDPTAVRARRPIEDFALYDIAFRGRTFRIYEGWAPRPPGRFIRSMSVALPAESVRLYRKEGQIEIYVDRGSIGRPLALDEPSPGPQFLHIWTSCGSADECGIEAFARLLMPLESEP